MADGLAGAKARRTRLAQSLANQQASFMGQKRGSRNIQDITEQFRPMQASYGVRGFGGPNVKSGIRRQGLARFAETMQRELGRETENMQTELNNIAATEAAQRADLDSYLNELQLSKSQQIMADAASLREFQGY
jgi:hypothetical protein